MTATRTEGPGGPAAAPPDGGPRRPLDGRSEVFVGLLTIGIGAFVGVQTATMHVPDNTASPGPQFFPAIVAIAMAALGAALIVQVVRRPAALPETPSGTGTDAPPAARFRTRSDWRTVGTVLAAVAAFTLLLNPLGWLLSGAGLFFGVSYAFGGRRIVFEAALALVYSSVVQLAFVAGLGLNLPSGILGGLL